MPILLFRPTPGMGGNMGTANFFQNKDTKDIYLGLSKDAAEGGALAQLKPNTVDAAVEKHVPDLTYKDGKLYVRVGSTEHPMLPEHYIEWIFVQTKDGGLYKKLNPGDKPEAVFTVEQADVVGVYEHCNLHGLWMK